MYELYACGYGVWVVVALLGWVAPVIVATIIGSKKGKGGLGFVLGFFLSWIGVIIIAVMEDEAKRDQEHRETLAAVGGGKQVVKVKCPKCGALADEGVKFCPGCGAPM